MEADASVSPETPKQAVEAAAKKSSFLLNAPATYLLLAINFIVFAVMLRYGPIPELARQHQFGACFTAPFSFNALAYFGGSESALVLHGEWWRPVTATFVHANLLHLLINMWCLWNLGVVGEPLLGKQGVVATYLLTGVCGNLLSLAATPAAEPDRLVVGASGAVFGIAGILIVLLSNRGLVNESLSWKDIKGLRRSVILFALLNLAFGVLPQFLAPHIPASLAARIHLDLSMLSRVDNTAHLGGLFAGLLLGVALFSRMMSGRAGYRARQRVAFAWATLFLALFAYGIHASRA